MRKQTTRKIYISSVLMISLRGMIAFFLPILGLGLLPSSLYAASVKLTFESISDGNVVGESLPGLRFSIDTGSWRYGDVRTGSYDAPYPRGAFAVDGNGFAWTGQAPGDARISFTEGTATFFAAAFSTRDSLTVTGYDSEDQELASAVVRPNINTGRLTVARVEAPLDRSLAYVVIRGTQNRWIMDNLETDAPMMAQRENAESALVTVVQRPSPNLTVTSDSVVSYDIVATNRGRGSARNVQITVPFDPSEVAVLDARFSRQSAWVSRLLTDTLQVDLGPLGAGGDTLTTTLRLRVLPNVVTGTPLGERLAVRWNDGAGGGTSQSNLPILVTGALTSGLPSYPLEVGRVSSDNQLQLGTSIFIPNEPVALWYDSPDGRSVPLGMASVDASGTLQKVIAAGVMPRGRSQIVVSGLWSGLTAAGIVELP